MKFSIRDLLQVTAIVALAVGWWVHHRALHNEYRRLESVNEALREELRELRFPKTESVELSQVNENTRTHTLEWIIPQPGN